MIKSFDDALDFLPRPEHRSPLSRFGNGLRTYWSALGDGLVAARRYHQMTARGMAHDEAVAKIFDEHFDAR